MDDRTYEWDAAKRAENLAKHGLDFALVRRFEWERAVAFVDERRDYGEIRRRTYGPIDGRPCVPVFTVRGKVVRVISLRKANRREIRRYGQCDGRKDPVLDDEDNPEWTKEDFARAKPIAEIPELTFLLKRGRPPMADATRKRRVTIMLDPDVIEHFKAEGKGWQTRVNAALRKLAGL